MKLFFGNNETIINPQELKAIHGYVPINDLLNLGKLNDLNDLTIASPQDNQFIVYDDANNVWKNKDPEDALIALGITATATELNYLDFSEQQGIDTKFLRGDGEWSDVTAAGITGLTSNGTDTLSLDANYKFSFEGTTSNNFETVFKAKDPTQDNTITLPDYSGEINLSPIQTIWCTSSSKYYTFTKNNEHVIFQGATGASPSSQTIYITLPNLSDLSIGNTPNTSAPWYGARFSFGRTMPGDVYIAPAASGVSIDIAGDGGNTLNDSYVGNSLITGNTYKITTLSGTTQTVWKSYAGLAPGDTDFVVGDFFTSVVTQNIVGTGKVYKAKKIPAESFKHGFVTITGVKGGAANSSNYFVENPNLSNIDTTLTGTTSATLLNSTTLSTSTLKLTTNSKTITVEGSSSLAADYTLKLPAAAPIDNSVLRHVSDGDFVWEEIKDDDEMGGETPSSTALVSQASIQNYIQSIADSLRIVDENSSPVYSINDTNTSVTLDDSAWGKEVIIDFTFTNSRDYMKSINVFMPEATSKSRAGQSIWLKFVNNGSITFPSLRNQRNFRIFPNSNDPQFHSVIANSRSNSVNNYSDYLGMFNYTADTSTGVQVVLTRNNKGYLGNSKYLLAATRLAGMQNQYNYATAASSYPLNSTHLNLTTIPSQQNSNLWVGATSALPLGDGEALVYKVTLEQRLKPNPVVIHESTLSVRFRPTGNTNNQESGSVNGKLSLSRWSLWIITIS